MYATVTAIADAERLPVGTIGWDRHGAPVAREAAGWGVIGGARIGDLADHLPLSLPAPGPADPVVDDAPCETCMTEQQAEARPDLAEPGDLVDRVAELIRAEFPDSHPHSRVTRLRSLVSAARIVTLLASTTPGRGQDPET